MSLSAGRSMMVLSVVSVSSSVTDLKIDELDAYFAGEYESASISLSRPIASR
jgi:hypothetical protein